MCGKFIKTEVLILSALFSFLHGGKARLARLFGRIYPHARAENKAEFLMRAHQGREEGRGEQAALAERAPIFFRRLEKKRNLKSDRIQLFNSSVVQI